MPAATLISCWAATTWKEPLAASYQLSAVIDLSSTGWLVTVVRSANGLRICGSRCTADSARASTVTGGQHRHGGQPAR